MVPEQENSSVALQVFNKDILGSRTAFSPSAWNRALPHPQGGMQAASYGAPAQTETCTLFSSFTLTSRPLGRFYAH